MNIQTNSLQLIYRKTPRGKHAIATRSIELTPQQRRILILIDGERTVGQLFAQLGDKTLLASLDELITQELISSAQPEASITPESSPAPNTSEIAIDGDKLVALKALMISSSEQCLGLMAQPLIREIEAVDSAKKLKMTLARWNMALRESRSATQQADHLLKAAKSLLA